MSRDALTPWRGTPREALRRRAFPNVLLNTHDGRQVRFYDDLLRGRVVVLNFMYLACGGTCPTTTHNLAQVQRRLHAQGAGEVRIYSITLFPETDTPRALAAYAREHQAGPGWLFLQARPLDTERLRRALGFVDRKPEVDALPSAHVNMLRFGNEPRSRWSSIYAGADPATIVSMIRALMDQRDPAPHRRPGAWPAQHGA